MSQQQFISSSVDFSGSVLAHSFTGSFQDIPGFISFVGTSSWANSTATASYINVTGSGIITNWNFQVSGSPILELTSSAEAKVIISDIPPTASNLGSPITTGSLWFDNISGSLYVWYVDVDGGQWLQTNAGVAEIQSQISANGFLYTASAVAQNLQSNINYTGDFVGSIGSALSMNGSISVDGTGSFYVMKNYQINDFLDDADAAAAGVPLGGFYRSGNVVVIRLV